MSTLTFQRCLNHAGREAVARCPVCRQFFCRECVTDHEGRVMCAACLRKLAPAPRRARLSFAWAIQVAGGLVGLLLAWFFFYLAGEKLLSLPSSFHEGTLWQAKWTLHP